MMRITGLRSEKKDGKVKVAATTIWEDCDRPATEIYFETVEAFSQGLTCNPHAFLIANIIPAMHYGEHRIFIDAEICPELRVGLMTVMSWLRHWYYQPGRKLVDIEAKTSAHLPSPRTPERAGFFYSGGIDSFATLRANRLDIPPEHFWFMQDGLFAYGLEMDNPQSFEYVIDTLSGVAQEIGINFIPVYTNLYLTYRPEDETNKFRFWTHEFQGAALSAIAHAFARRLTVVSIASGDDIANLNPYGSHPVLDPNYSSVDLRIRHDNVHLSRLEKTRLIADWEVALQHLRVCNHFRHYSAGHFNCGRCEKCVRTMLALVALGVLDRTQAFSEDDVSVEVAEAGVHVDEEHIHYYTELLTPLAQQGRQDLVQVVERKIAQFHRQQKASVQLVQRGSRQFRKYVSPRAIKKRLAGALKKGNV